MIDSNDFNELLKKLKNGSSEENKQLAADLKNSMTQQQKDALNKVFSNKDLLHKLLNSDEAKNIINKLGGE